MLRCLLFCCSAVPLLVALSCSSPVGPNTATVTPSLPGSPLQAGGDSEEVVSGVEGDIPPDEVHRPPTPRNQLPWSAEPKERPSLSWRATAWSEKREDFGHDLAVADFNGDGRDDIFVAAFGAKDRVYVGGADGQLREAWVDPENRDTHGVALGDFNADGTPDVATADNGGTSRIWLGPDFKESVELPGMWLAKSVVLGDVDADGDCDVLLGLDGPNQLFLNEKGTLRAAWSAPNEDATDSLDLKDIDGDGDLDLLVGNSTTAGLPNRVYLFEGGGFRLVWSSPEKRSTNGIRWVDLDGDGVPEIVTANADGADQVFGKEGEGYQLLWETPEVDESLGVAVGDLDADGHPDLVFLTSSGIFIHLNRSRSFVSGRVQSPMETPQAVALMDVDGDGRGDPVVAGLGSVWVAVVLTEVLATP